MPQAESTAVYVKAQDRPVREGKFNYISFNGGDRLGRAFGAFAVCLLFAVVAVFIPIAHFVLVPGLIILGLFMFVSRYRAQSAAQNITVTCPVCEQAVTIKLDAEQQPPFYCYCSNCSSNLHVTGS